MTHWHEQPPAHHARPDIAQAVPTLRTDRLALRAPRLDDFPLLVAIDASVEDVSLRSHNGREGTWSDFMQMTATWLLRGHGWWTVDDKNGPAGFVGLGFEPGDHEPELGYLFAPHARGKGYATEACTAARNFARDTARLPSLVSYISDANAASQNVARKLGAQRDTVAETALNETGVQIWRHWNTEA